MTRIAERDVTEPELGHLAAVDDERSDGVGPWSERPLVDLRLAELIGNFEHLVERVTQVCLKGRGTEFHAHTVSKAGCHLERPKPGR